MKNIYFNTYLWIYKQVQKNNQNEKPFITLYTICYNEELILPYFLKHYSQFVSRFVFFDNESNDKTLTILNEFKEAEVIIINHNTNGEIRDDLYLQIKNNCWKGDKSDYVIVCDVDEFLYHPDIIYFLKQNKKYDYFQPFGFNMYALNFLQDKNKQIYSIINQGVKEDKFSKSILFKPKFVRETNFGAGSHSARYVPVKLRKYHRDDLKLLHYKYVDLAHVIDRYRVFNLRLSKENVKNNWGIHYTYEEEKIKEAFRIGLENSEKVI